MENHYRSFDSGAMIVRLTKPQADAIEDRIAAGSESAYLATRAGMQIIHARASGRPVASLIIPQVAERFAIEFFANYGQLARDALGECRLEERGSYRAELNAALRVGQALGVDILNH